MATKKSHSGKMLFIVILLVGVAAAGFGYIKQSSVMKPNGNSADTQSAAKAPPPTPDNKVFGMKPDDVVIGNENAPVTLIEYASLSCPHCAHFHENVFPELKKEFLDTGKARLLFRHFPLNEPALRAAQLVECAPKAQRPNFLKVLFTMQNDWAFVPNFTDGLKRIALTGGVDAATFDSCMKDKDIETRILATRQEGAVVAQVDSTPSIFVNGVKYPGVPTIENLRTAIKSAPSATPAQPAPAAPPATH